MKHFFIVALMLLQGQSLFAQDSSNFDIRFNWNFNPEIEYRLHNRFTTVQSIGSSYRLGLMNSNYSVLPAPLALHHNLAYRSELRYYLGQRNSPSQLGVNGFQGFYTSAILDVNLSPYVSTNQNETPYRQGSVGINIGFQKNIGKRFYCKVELGIGLDKYSDPDLAYRRPFLLRPLGSITFGLRDFN